MTTPQIPFRRNAVEPTQCIKAGWELVRQQYWLFVGICLVGVLVGSAVPMGILMGPMMCGIYLAFFKQRRGEPIEFGTLFKGFDYFAQSVIAALLHTLPIMAIIIPAYIFFYLTMIVSMAAMGDEPSGVAVLGVFATFGLFWLVVMVLVIVITIGFSFAYPLIVDRQLPGFEAVKLSFKAAMANFWRLLAVVLLTGLLSFAGVLLCYVGAIFVMPISYAALAVAYEQVFGLRNPGEEVSNLPPPPPIFS